MLLKMSNLRSFVSSILLIFTLIVVVKGDSKSSFGATACRFLRDKLTVSSPWAVDPLLFEPIQRGRLTVWTGVSTLATSDFKCSPIDSGDSDTNRTSELILDFSNFANKLEWTFYDLKSGITHQGLTINLRDNGRFKIKILDKQTDSYLNCNIIDEVKLLDDNTEPPTIQTYCLNCDKSIVSLVDVQIEEMFKSRLNGQIEDNLYWQLTQLISSQNFGRPLMLKNNLD